MLVSALKLFKALPVKKDDYSKTFATICEKFDTIHKKTIPLGFVFSPDILLEYPGHTALINEAQKHVGISAKEANSSFHKSWEKVKTADIEQLVSEQVVHYMTTYGFETLGIYSKESVYIPAEELKIPKIKLDKIKLSVVRGLTKDELKSNLLALIGSGIALSEETIKDVLDVALFLKLDAKDIETVKNKEVKCALYDHLDMIPENPTEFLRYIVFKSIDKTLLIKSKEVIAEIKSKKNIGIPKLFDKYEKEFGLNALAGVFLRFKPLFLAFRTNSALKSTVNRLRRLADTHHKPMPEDYLNSITKRVKNGDVVDFDVLDKELSRVNTFRKIRLSYALHYRMQNPDSILYKIRNGKSYVEKYKPVNAKAYQEIYDHVVDSIVSDVKKNVNGKTIYIPSYIEYALPATEKQFTGNFPSGTCVTVDSDMVFGVNWYNAGKNRIDLDLSLITLDGTKIGWNGDYRTNSIAFSGDMTDASGKDGSTELFYVNKLFNGSAIMYVNYFNCDESIEVPFKILAAKEKVSRFERNYMVNPNNMLAVSSSTISKPQKILGVFMGDGKQLKFYFSETYMGKNIASCHNDKSKQSLSYLNSFYSNPIGLKDILLKAGCKVITDKIDGIDINLAPEELTKNSIISLLS